MFHKCNLLPVTHLTGRNVVKFKFVYFVAIFEAICGVRMKNGAKWLPPQTEETGGGHFNGSFNCLKSKPQEKNLFAKSIGMEKVKPTKSKITH